MNEAIVQSPVQPQTSNAKFRRISSAAIGVRDLRMEQQAVQPPRAASCMAATGALALVATTANPSGAAST